MLRDNQVQRPMNWVFPVLLAMYEMAQYLANDAYLPALPGIAGDLGAPRPWVQWTLTAWFLGSFSMQLFLGPVTDRFGRRPALLWGGLIFLVSTLGCAVAHTIEGLLFFRLIQGATVSSMVVSGYATIHELLEQKQAIHVLAIMGSITILAPAFGPLLGAFILQFGSWRWIFGILAIWGMAVLVGLFFKMPETKSPSRENISLNQILGQYREILFNKSFMRMMFKVQCFFATLIVWIAAGSFLLIDHFRETELDFALTQALIFGGFILGSRSVKPVMQRLSLKTVIQVATVMSCLGGVYALLAGVLWPEALWNFIVAMVFLAFAAGLGFPVLSRCAIEASDQPMGSKVAMSSFLLGLSGAVVSVLVGFVYQGSIFSLAWIVCLFSLLPLLFI